MSAKLVIDALRQQLETLKSQGSTLVNIDSLENYLGNLESGLQSQTTIDQIHIDFRKQENEFNNQSAQELFRSVVSSGQAALKTSILVGGGSAAALLAFASSAWRSLKPEGLDALALSVFLLAVGVLCSAIATGTNYVCQFFYHDSFYDESRIKDRIGDAANIFSNLLVLASYSLYGYACWNVYKMLGLLDVIKPLAT